MNSLEPTKPNQLLRAPVINFSEKFFTFYLSHPFASREYIRKWELEFEERNPEIALVNPFFDVGELEGREDLKAKDEGRGFIKTPGYDSRLVKRDLIAVLFSRGIVGVVDHNSDKSIGTIMEFVYARALANNPKLLICTNGHHEHPWLKTHFHRVYESFEKFEEDVKNQIDRVKTEWGF